MKMVIIEDEPLASKRLQLLLQQYDSSAEIAASLDSIEESLKWFDNNPLPDLLFADIQLSDGSVFEFFRKTKTSLPVIFTTAYDAYALDAFKLLSIDYLLKPVTLGALSTAIDKLKSLKSQQVSSINYDDIIKMIQEKTPHYKSRFTGKVGNKLFFIETKNVAFFCADNKIVSIISTDDKKYISDYTLEHLEDLLDPCSFFRINRRAIVNIAAISQVKPYENNRLQVILKNTIRQEELIVSRERVMDFRKWADN